MRGVVLSVVLYAVASNATAWAGQEIWCDSVVASKGRSNAIPAAPPGGTGVGPQPGDLSIYQREALRAKIRKLDAESAEITERISRLDKAIAAAELLDFAVGQVLTLLPAAGGYGGVAYNSGKAIGYTLAGDAEEANKATVKSLLGVVYKLGPTTGDTMDAMAGYAAKTAIFAIDANDAVRIGKDVGQAFGPQE